MLEQDFIASLAVIDHRAENSEVVEEILKQIDDEISYEESNDGLAISFENKNTDIPITHTRHDKYIVLSSLAELLKEKYSFFISEDNLEDDTHSIWVKSINDELLPENDQADLHFIPMTIGYDYFHGITIPYLNNEGNNPDFAWESEKLDEGLHLVRTDLVKEKLAELKKEESSKSKMSTKMVAIVISVLLLIWIIIELVTK